MGTQSICGETLSCFASLALPAISGSKSTDIAASLANNPTDSNTPVGGFERSELGTCTAVEGHDGNGPKSCSDDADTAALTFNPRKRMTHTHRLAHQ